MISVINGCCNNVWIIGTLGVKFVAILQWLVPSFIACNVHELQPNRGLGHPESHQEENHLIASAVKFIPC